VLTTFVRFGAIGGFLGVALGAFGAHALRDRITPDLLAVYQTGVQYHLVHALALLFVGLLADRLPTAAARMARVSGTLFAVGVLLFSGSLYALALTGVRKLGIVTPFGGVCFLTGWALLVVAVSMRQREPAGRGLP
jgi:uncharacterized membrane protein YgdD (TMEM256/DUF423 family)